MTGLQLKYFVLNPTSSDLAYAFASQQAMHRFADMISGTNPELAKDLRIWSEEAYQSLSINTDNQSG